MYITVVQNDEGIGQELQLLYRNILTISSGGYGYAIIPLLLKPLKPLPSPSKRATLLSFTGSLRTHATRKRCNLALHGLFKNNFKSYEGNEWLRVVNNSRFVVCPRGFGRSAFKIYETFDLQRVPIYVYDDIPWIPYENDIDWADISIPIHISKLHRLPQILEKINETEYNKMIYHMRKIHANYFTFSGVLEKIGEFIQQPWSASIICRGLPSTVR